MLRTQAFILPAALCAALAAAPACARAEPALVALVNAYRANPVSCDGRPAAPAPALTPQAALDKVRIGPGSFVELELEKAGYQAERAQAISVTGPQDAKSAMAVIAQRYCKTLLSDRFSAIGASRTGSEWLVVLAEPMSAPQLPDWPDAGQAILQAVNAVRAAGRVCGDRPFQPAPPLSWNGELGEAALAHSRNMAELRYFSHQERDGSEVGDRAHRAGYQWRRIGENIAAGQRSPEEAVAGWLSSPGHCANIMNSSFTEMGAGYAINSAGRSARVYWTQVFGSR